jgi:hypothetical protein
MMPKYWIIVGLAAFGCFAGCSGRGSSGKDVELLTNSPWKYERAGFNDEDASFDALNPQIAGNEKDNTIIFCKDGTGYSQFAHRNRAGSPDSFPFIWAFSNDSTIYFQDQYYKVRVLTSKRLEIYADQKFGSAKTRYTIILRR